MSLKSTIRKTLEAVLPKPLYAKAHAAAVKRRARTWLDSPDPDITSVLQSYLSPGGVALDIGANLGLWSLNMSRRVGPSGLIHAFEPVDEFMMVLKDVLKAFDATNVITHQVAISDKPGSISFATHDERGNYLSGEAHITSSGEKGNMSVECTTLDTLIGSLERVREVKLMKVDVEGAELMLFKGAAQFLREIRPTTLLVIVKDRR